MTDREAFIAAIAANPRDDVPRLVFADWLDEHGEAARAGFIRDQVHLAKLGPGSDEYRQLFSRTAETLRANLPAWIQDVCEAFGQPTEWGPGKQSGARLGVDVGRFGFVHHHSTTGNLYTVEFRRGFLEQATISPFDEAPPTAVEHLLRTHPVTRLGINMPKSAVSWERLSIPELNQVRALDVAGSGSPDVNQLFFDTPVWAGVRRLTVSVLPMPSLSRTSLAKRLVGLRIHATRGMFDELAQFPLDDRLQEFVILRSIHELLSPGHPRRVTDISDLSAVAFRPTLKRLDLTGCTVGDRGLAMFARGDVWIRLKALVLDRNRFGDPGWRDFVRGHRTPELRLLSASRNFITNDGAERLGRSSLAATLEYVDLRGNRIDGKGAISLARSLAEGPLKKLLLAGNPIGPRDAARVRQVLGLRVDVSG